MPKRPNVACLDAGVIAWHKRLLYEDPKRLFSKAPANDYVPKERYLTPDEYISLMECLPPKRRFHVAFLVRTACRWSESLRVCPNHIDPYLKILKIPGTKTKQSDRTLPLTPDLWAILEKATIPSVASVDTPFFEKWTNVRRDLIKACKGAGIDPISPNDLRRTLATWMKAASIDSAVVARYLGHTTTRMVDQIYGKIPFEVLRRASEKIHLPGLPLPTDCSTYVQQQMQKMGQNGPMEPDTRGDAPVSHDGKTQEKTPTSKEIGVLCVVPRDGVEPPTQGFSVPCSTN